MFEEIMIYHNSLEKWLIAVGLASLIFISAEVSRRAIHKKLSAFAAKTIMIWDDLLTELIGRLNSLFVLAIALYIGSLGLSLPKTTEAVLGHSVGIVALIQIAILCTHCVGFWVSRFREQKLASNAGAVTTLTSVGFVLRALIWIILILIGLDNLGINITALIAGLGIGGIAVALAIQNILGDLFASFSIVLDKPFVIGEFIVIDAYMGTIEHVGLKTTRIRSLSGEQMILSNTDLLRSRIRNYKRMHERRVVFTIGVVYQTPHEKIGQIPGMLRKAVESNPQTRFERAHFKEFGDFSLKFEIVFWIESPDYGIYMDIQQAINLDIFRQFTEAGIEFAYPTQTLIVQGSSGERSAF